MIIIITSKLKQKLLEFEFSVLHSSGLQRLHTNNPKMFCERSSEEREKSTSSCPTGSNPPYRSGDQWSGDDARCVSHHNRIQWTEKKANGADGEGVCKY